VSKVASEALMDFFVETKDFVQCWVRHLVIDNCDLGDS